jgi:hypothetical protein
MAASYNTHFATYFSVTNQVTHLIPVIVWKRTYNDYVTVFPNSPFYEDTLKGPVAKCLKGFKN